MKSLNEIPPAWSQRLDSTDGSTNPIDLGCDSSRFKCVMYSGPTTPAPEGVLDLETGLVWERGPAPGTRDDWFGAVFICAGSTAGDRKGWRLPRIEELMSLVDPTQTDPALPQGHPFINVTETGYWSATTSHLDTTYAHRFQLINGADQTVTKETDQGVWCVRGGTLNTFTSQPNSP